jgi:hypothetical protein
MDLPSVSMDYAEEKKGDLPVQCKGGRERGGIEVRRNGVGRVFASAVQDPRCRPARDPYR